MKDKTWEEIRLFYLQRFDIDPELVDIVADMEILKLCVSGASNDHIADSLELSTVHVSDTIQRYFHFPGWRVDLDINPLSLYRKNSDYVQMSRSISNLSPEEIRICHGVCSIYDELEALINEHWV